MSYCQTQQSNKVLSVNVEQMNVSELNRAPLENVKHNECLTVKQGTVGKHGTHEHSIVKQDTLGKHATDEHTTVEQGAVGKFATDERLTAKDTT